MKLRRKSETAPPVTIRRGCGNCADVARPQDRFCRRCGAYIDHDARPVLEGEYGDVEPFAFYGPSPGHQR